MRNLVIKLCAFVAMIASVTPNVCRSNWYEPEEPVITGQNNNIIILPSFIN